MYANVSRMGIGQAPVGAPAAPVAPAAPAAPLTSRFSSLLPVAYLPTSQGVTTFLFMLYKASIFLFVLFLILTFINFTIFPVFSLSPDDNGIIPIPLPSDRQLVFTEGPAPSDLSANVVNIPACTYSFSMDIYLSGDFQAMTIPRVLFYRSTRAKGVSPPSDIINWSTGSSGSSGSGGSGGSGLPGRIPIHTTLAATFPDTNFILWLDPVKNDLLASIITSSDGSAANARVETTKPVENVPIRKVFRLTVVFTQKFVELYINGNLEQSMPLKHLPLTVAPTSYFFPVISTIGPNTRIANVAFWPRTLSAKEVRAYGKPMATETFFNAVRR
jgi:hypothetical protein